MARARNIKPGFFTNDELVELPFEVRLLFIGLWTIADKEGRLADRPKKIKMEIFPADDVDCDKALSLLAGKGFIRRYQKDGGSFIQICNWDRHQNPHIKEAPSVIPAENEAAPEIPVQAPEIPERAGLIPDSLNLIPDSGSPIPSTLIPDPKIKTFAAPENPEPAPKREKFEPDSKEAWLAYGEAYRQRYGAYPVRNAPVNTSMAAFVKRVGKTEAPGIAAFYVGHNNSFYVRSMHPVKILLSDAEKLRTEWATDRTVTATQAAQVDKTQTNLNVFGPMIEAAKAREALENANAE